MSMNELPKDEGLEKFEEQLRRFRPSAPRALKMPTHRRHWPAIGAAAVVLAIVTMTLVQRSSFIPVSNRDTQPQSTVKAHLLTAAQLRTALLAGDEDFDRVLDDASPGILPHGHHGTVLDELGKE